MKSDSTVLPDAADRAEVGFEAALQLQKVSAMLVQEGNLDALYGHFLDAAVVLMSADMGSLQVCEPETKALRLLAHRGFDPQAAAYWHAVSLDSAPSCAGTGAAEARTLVRDVELDAKVIGTPDLDAYRRANIRAMQSTPLVSRSGKLLGMISTYWCQPHEPTEMALRLLDVLSRQAADLIERIQVENTLRESEVQAQRLASIVESSDDAIISKDLDGTITSWNRGAERIFGYFAEEAIGRPITMLIPADRQDEELTIIDRIRRGERVDHYETIRRRKSGELINISLTVSPVRNKAGTIVGASKIARDITERKRIETQMTILAREAEHRAKNMLASVLAAVHLSSADTVEGLKQTIEGRIQALANVHALFVQSRWIGADLRSIVAQELSPYCRDGDQRSRVEGPDRLLEPDAAQAIAVTLHELATNAAKYGALSVPEGRVSVDWAERPEGGIGLRWREESGPAVQPVRRRGVGTRVMEGMVAGQLKGRIDFAWTDAGLVCEILW